MNHRGNVRPRYEKEGEVGELQTLDDFACASSVTNSKFLELKANGLSPIWPLYCDSFYAKAPNTNGLRGGAVISEAVEIDAMMPWFQPRVGLCPVPRFFSFWFNVGGQASWGPAWGMPLSPVALMSTNADSCPSMLVKYAQNSVALQLDSKGEGSLQFLKTLRIDNPKGASCDGRSILPVGTMRIDLSGDFLESLAIMAQEDASWCPQTLKVLLEEQFSFLARGINVISVILEQYQVGFMLEIVGIIDGKGDADTNINGHWNLNSKTTIHNFHIALLGSLKRDDSKKICVDIDLEWISFPVIHIALLGSLKRDDSKKICVDIDLEWISFPVSEQVKWLNRQLNKMWPFVADAVTRGIRQSVELLLEESTPRNMTRAEIGGGLTVILGLSDMIDDTVDSIVSDTLQWLHQIVIPIGGGLEYYACQYSCWAIHQHVASVLSQLLILNALKGKGKFPRKQIMNTFVCGSNHQKSKKLVGVVSNEKLLDLLELAADIARTGRRARELMDVGIEPMALMFRLAFLIMDILAGSYKLTDIKGKGTFFCRHALAKEDASVTQSPIALRERNEKGLLYFDFSTKQVLDKENQFEAPLEELVSKMMSKSRMGKKAKAQTHILDYSIVFREHGRDLPIDIDDNSDSGQTDFSHMSQGILDDILEARINLASLAGEAEDIISLKDSADLLKFSASKWRKRTSMTTVEGRHQSESTTVNSDQGRIHRETFMETHNTVNGPEAFTTIGGSL
eukprot:Gb_36352 [translate_table: standard]